MRETMLLLGKWITFNVVCGGSLERFLALRARAAAGAAKLGLYERASLKALKRLVHPGDVVIDVGANFGAYSLTLARLVGPTGRVWAFEPLPLIFDHLVANTKARGNVFCRPVGLSSSDSGLATLKIPMLFGKIPEPSLASVGQPISQHLGLLRRWAVGANQTREARIELRSLDGMMGEIGPATFIKVDVEGHELSFFAGAMQYLRTHRPVVQFEELEIEARRREYEALASSLGYRLRQLDADGTFRELAGAKGNAAGNNYYLVP